MKSFCTIIFICAFQLSYCQNNSDSVFLKIKEKVEQYKMDTTSPPNDKVSDLIIQLRALRGGFNINEALNFKLEEDLQKKDITEIQYNSLKEYFNKGSGKRLLNNAVVWIYRNTFDKRELKQLVKFYKTSAGQKFSHNFPIIMLETLMAAQVLKSQIDSPK